MKIYLVRTEKQAIRWVGTQAAARKLVTWIKKFMPKYSDVYSEEHDVPTKKLEVLEWLNKWNLEDIDEGN
jgi:hypothetical protein